jgi:hypothetical protein
MATSPYSNDKIRRVELTRIARASLRLFPRAPVLYSCRQKKTQLGGGTKAEMFGSRPNAAVTLHNRWFSKASGAADAGSLMPYFMSQ